MISDALDILRKSTKNLAVSDDALLAYAKQVLRDPASELSQALVRKGEGQKQALRDAMEKRPKLRLNVVLTMAQQNALESIFSKHLDLSFTKLGGSANPHAMANAVRDCERAIGIRFLRGAGGIFLDFGGNYVPYVVEGVECVHCCSPKKDWRDAVRAKVRQEMYEAMTGDAGGTPTWNCTLLAEECDVQGKCALCLDAAYDIVFENWPAIMARHGTEIVYGNLNMPVGLVFEDTGRIPVIDCVYKCYRDEHGVRKVRYAFEDDPSWSYPHDVANLMKYTKDHVFQRDDGTCYLYKVGPIRPYGITFTITKLAARCAPGLLNRSRCVTRSLQEVVVLKGYDVDEMTQQVFTREVKVDVKVFNHVLLRAAAIDDERLTKNNVAKLLSVLGKSFRVNGTELAGQLQPAAEDLGIIAVTILLIIHRDRRGVAGVNKLFAAKESRKREFGDAGFVQKLATVGKMFAAGVSDTIGSAYAHHRDELCERLMNMMDCDLHALVDDMLISVPLGFSTTSDKAFPFMRRDEVKFDVSKVLEAFDDVDDSDDEDEDTMYAEEDDERKVADSDCPSVEDIYTPNTAYSEKLGDEDTMLPEGKEDTSETVFKGSVVTNLARFDPVPLGKPVSVETVDREMINYYAAEEITRYYDRVDKGMRGKLILQAEKLAMSVATHTATQLLTAAAVDGNPNIFYVKPLRTPGVKDGSGMANRAFDAAYRHSGLTQFYMFGYDILNKRIVTSSTMMDDQGNKLYCVWPRGVKAVFVNDSAKIHLADRQKRACAKAIAPFRTRQRIAMPELHIVVGIAGAGKSRKVNFDYVPGALVLCYTREATETLRWHFVNSKKMTEDYAEKYVRTIASYVVNGGVEAALLQIDEAVMMHYGEVVVCALMAKAQKIILYGDPEQIKFIRREVSEPIHYAYSFHPQAVLQMRVSDRFPASAAAGLRLRYNSAVWTTSKVEEKPTFARVGSIKEAIAEVPPDHTVLVFYQDDKQDLVALKQSMEQGKNEDVALMSVGEAQGQTIKNVCVVRTSTTRKDLYQSSPHLIVAFSRHTHKFKYVTVMEGTSGSEKSVRECLADSRDGLEEMLLEAQDDHKIVDAKYDVATGVEKEKWWIRGRDFNDFDFATGQFILLKEE